MQVSLVDYIVEGFDLTLRTIRKRFPNSNHGCWMQTDVLFLAVLCLLSVVSFSPVCFYFVAKSLQNSTLTSYLHNSVSNCDISQMLQYIRQEYAVYFRKLINNKLGNKRNLGNTISFTKWLESNSLSSFFNPLFYDSKIINFCKLFKILLISRCS